MRDSLSPREAAIALGVSEASIKRWCDKGVFATTRTVGGHRRITTASVISFLRASGRSAEDPERLGIADAFPKTEDSGSRDDLASDSFRAALESGDESAFRSLALARFVAGVALPELFDREIAPAFVAIGDAWEHGRVDVYQERRACEICSRFLHELRGMIDAPAPDAPYAIGGSLSGDPYSIGSAMAELTLRDLGWRAEAYGVDLPPASLENAIRTERPSLVWISVAHLQSVEEFVGEYSRLYDSARKLDVAVVVGGRAIDDRTRARIRSTAHCDTMEQLAEFARALYHRPDRSRR